MRILFTGGGTGGHIYPALSLAEVLQREDGADIQFVGTVSGLERELVPRAGFKLHTITVAGLERRFSWRTIITFAKLGQGLWQAFRFLRSYRPHVVVGTGGYVSVPVVYMASLLGIPTLIHEQNVLPGLANRFLSRYADTVALSYQASVGYFTRARRLVVTGNPIREEITRLSREEGRRRLGLPRDKKMLLVFGGSRGARPINDAMLAAIPFLQEQADLFVYYITGKEDYGYIRHHLNGGIGSGELGNIKIEPYLHDMPAALAAADLVVSRAGATTLAELTARGIPAILIPSPYVTGNHQEYNARLLAEVEGALMIRESDLEGQVLAETVKKLLGDREHLERMGTAGYTLGRREALASLVGEIRDLGRRSKG